MFPNHIIKEWLNTSECFEAQEFIKKYHYLKSLPRGTKRMYTLHWNNKLIGVATFGSPVGRGYPPTTTELKRFVLLPDLPTNSASWFLSRCLKMLACSEFTEVLSYADPGMGHEGIMYKAANFNYKGVQKFPTPVYSVKGTRVYARNIKTTRNKVIKSLKEQGKLKVSYMPRKHIFTYNLVK